MKHVKSLILMLLIPLTMFLGSCSNELEEELMVEVEYYGDFEDDIKSVLDMIDYFELDLFPVPEEGEELEESDFVLFGEKLYRGDVLRLENLEPGKYHIDGCAYQIQDEDDSLVDRVSVSFTGNTMDDDDNFLVERGLPTIIKMVIFVSN